MHPTSDIRRTAAASAVTFIVNREVVPGASAGGLHSSDQISEAGFLSGYCHFNFAAPCFWRIVLYAHRFKHKID